MSLFWQKVGSNEFDLTVRRVGAPEKYLRFLAGRTAFGCDRHRCNKIKVLEICRHCGEQEYVIDTYTGNIGLYCRHCRKGFDKHVCACGFLSDLNFATILKRTQIGKLSFAMLLPLWTIKVLAAKPAKKRANSQTEGNRSAGKAAKKSKAKSKPATASQQAKPGPPAKKYTSADVNNWLNVYHQRKAGWIGEGFLGRAVAELQIMARSGYSPALKALESLFKEEKDSYKRAMLARALKELTGKDFLPKHEINRALSIHPMQRLPEAPKDLP